MAEKKIKTRNINLMTSLIMSIALPNYVKNCKNGGFLKNTILIVREKILEHILEHMEHNNNTA